MSEAERLDRLAEALADLALLRPSDETGFLDRHSLIQALRKLLEAFRELKPATLTLELKVAGTGVTLTWQNPGGSAGVGPHVDEGRPEE
jgi:hypothetical protein